MILQNRGKVKSFLVISGQWTVDSGQWTERCGKFWKILKELFSKSSLSGFQGRALRVRFKPTAPLQAVWKE